MAPRSPRPCSPRRRLRQKQCVGGKTVVRIGIIIGSTRPGRNGEAVARWVYEQARKRTDAEFELVDLKDFNLPIYDEPVPPSFGKNYRHEHTRRWSEKIDSFDGFIFVTPEYNHATSGALKNAIDYLYLEWNNKAAAFVGYGSLGGARAIENPRAIASELQMAHVRQQVSLSLFTDFENFSVFKPNEEVHLPALNTMLDQLIAWSAALKRVRQEAAGA